jgi:hypothetical protein
MTNKIVGAVILVVLVAVLGAAFTPLIQDQTDSWSANLTTAGQTGAAAVVDILPLLFWILLAIGVLLVIIAVFLPGKMGGM